MWSKSGHVLRIPEAPPRQVSGFRMTEPLGRL